MSGIRDNATTELDVNSNEVTSDQKSHASLYNPGGTTSMHRIYSNVNNQESDPQQQQLGINERSAGVNELSGDVSSIKLGQAKEKGLNETSDVEQAAAAIGNYAHDVALPTPTP